MNECLRLTSSGLGVSSQHWVDRVESKSIWGLRPEFAEVFVGVRPLMVRFMRSTCPLVHGWLGLVSLCSIP